MKTVIALKLIKKIPWSKVVENAPLLFTAAQNMYRKYRENSTDKKITLDQLQEIVESQAKIIEELAAANAVLVEKIEKQQNKLKVCMLISIFALICSMFLLFKQLLFGYLC